MSRLFSRHIIFLLMCCVITQPQLAYADEEEKQEIRLGYIEFPPVFSTNSKGSPEGQLIDLARMVIPRAGYRWKAFSMPAKRMATNIVHGELDLWIGLSTLPEFQNTTYIGQPVVSTIELNAYWIGEKKPINSKSELSGKSVITLHGYSYGGWINYIHDPANNVQECRAFNQSQALNMLKYGRCDYLLNYTGPMSNNLHHIPIENLSFNRISALEARFVVSKQTKNADKLISSLVRAYNELVAEGKWPMTLQHND